MMILLIMMNINKKIKNNKRLKINKNNKVKNKIIIIKEIKMINNMNKKIKYPINIKI